MSQTILQCTVKRPWVHPLRIEIWIILLHNWNVSSMCRTRFRKFNGPPYGSGLHPSFQLQTALRRCSPDGSCLAYFMVPVLRFVYAKNLRCVYITTSILHFLILSLEYNFWDVWVFFEMCEVSTFYSSSVYQRNSSKLPKPSISTKYQIKTVKANHFVKYQVKYIC